MLILKVKLLGFSILNKASIRKTFERYTDVLYKTYVSHMDSHAHIKIVENA